MQMAKIMIKIKMSWCIINFIIILLGLDVNYTYLTVLNKSRRPAPIGRWGSEYASIIVFLEVFTFLFLNTDFRKYHYLKPNKANISYFLQLKNNFHNESVCYFRKPLAIKNY